MPTTVRLAPHPLLEVGLFVTRFTRPLGELSLASGELPAAPDEQVRTTVRTLLRHGGFKPSGRSKPASEYLVAAAVEGRFPRINAAVDACNIASLRSGLPISLVDLDKVEGALAIGVLPMGTSYVFNPSGQVIDAGGLLALSDAIGPTGTPVKDAQRTKTDAATRTTLSIVWGTHELPGRTAEATRWYRALVETIEGATTDDVGQVSA